MVLNCKVCGGSLQMLDRGSVYKCEYCGKEQTIPQIDDDQVLGMINRANHFRQVFEFDKAIEIYERIIESGAKDADIYWALVLCRYGIEYVDDPVTKEKIPTCHRAQYKSVLEDADYLMALSCADSLQKDLYEKEANYISQVQKGILEISNKEDPFDVFICYKESDDSGKRTTDSVLAQDIYYQLTERKYKVFFSRITLESKLGQQYESYIFAALNSAKVMIVLGTRPEYYNAVWVKNEWNRFLDIMHNDKSRLIIPAYKDFDPYDLPDELSYFQALDMSKIGFVQDLIRGIDKVLDKTSGFGKETVYENTISSAASSNVTALLKRGELALEDEDWDKAYDYYNQVLNLDAESSEAYLGQALSRIRVKSLDSLVEERIGKFESNLRQIELKSIEVEDDSLFEEMLNLIKENKVLIGNSVDFKKYIVTIKSGVASIETLIKEEEAWFDSDKSLMKAIRFSEKIKKEIQEAKKAILDRMYSERDSLKASEDSQRSEALSECKSYYEDFRRRITEKIEQRKAEYETLKSQFYSGDFSSLHVGGLKGLQGRLRGFLGYQDANTLWQDISVKIQEKDKQIQALKEREKEILYHEFAQIKGFNKGQKREKLQLELEEVQKKIKILQEEL